MTSKRWILCLACAVALAAETGPELFQKAVVQERAAGNLEEAIKLYQRVAKEFASDRALAAKALVQAARCYEKLGQDKSVKVYEQVAREYSDQREYAAAARERLTVIGAAKPKSAPGMVARQIPLSMPGGLKQTDGRHIFYVNGQGLMVTGMDAAEGRMLVEARTFLRGGVLSGYVVSRDGKQVAFGLTRDQESLWVAAVDGSGAREIYPVNRRRALRILDWSPDGSHILASVFQPDQTWALMSISAADGSARKLSGDQKPLSPGKFSPDGKYVAYSTPDTVPPLSPADIYTVPVDGGQPVKLVEHSTGDKLLDWTPDGAHLLFLSDRKGTPSIYALPVSQGRATGEPVLVKQDTGFITYASMSRDGTLYYSVGSGTHSELHLVSLDPVRKMVTATPRRVADRRMENQNWGAWSPDGRLLAYVATHASQRPVAGGPIHPIRLIVREVDTGHEREFTIQGMRGHPCWAPNGDAIYVSHGLTPLTQQFALESVSATTGEVTQLAVYPERRSMNSISRSPDGKALLIGFFDVESSVKSRLPRAYVVRRDLETGEETEIVSKSAAANLLISPDGKRVASVDFQRGTDPTISVKPLDGGEWKRIATVNGANLEGLRWSPDSRVLAFTASEGVGSSVLAVNADGGDVRTLASFPESPRIYIADIHPDGRQILFNFTVANSELWALENLLPKLKAAK
jgi:Tol biopolymer transport system component